MRSDFGSGYSSQTAAERLGWDEETVLAAIAAGWLPGIRVVDPHRWVPAAAVECVRAEMALGFAPR